MPAADPSQEEGDPKANKMYEIALAAREATEKLVEALDDPVFDDGYEFAFKASAALRHVLNSLEAAGAHPTPEQRVVAPSVDQQKYGRGGSYQREPSAAASGGTAFGIHPQSGVALSDIAEAAGEEQLVGSRFGQGALSKGAHAAAIKAKGTQLAQGDALGGVDQKERKMLQDLENILTKVADQDNLLKFRPITLEYLKKIQALMTTTSQQGQK
tara:strand:- start:1220 stop:1861 length:642 start_codon:yes stop_codon:yes gene_type:complete